MTALNPFMLLVGRVLLAIMFIGAGWSKIGGYEGTQGYMEAAGVPGILLPLVIIVELVGGIMVLIGFMTRWWALALAGFTALAALLFHQYWADPSQYNAFIKNIAIAGGFLVLAAAGPGALSVDGRRR